MREPQKAISCSAAGGSLYPIQVCSPPLRIPDPQGSASSITERSQRPSKPAPMRCLSMSLSAPHWTRSPGKVKIVYETKSLCRHRLTLCPGQGKKSCRYPPRSVYNKRGSQSRARVPEEKYRKLPDHAKPDCRDFLLFKGLTRYLSGRFHLGTHLPPL